MAESAVSFLIEYLGSLLIEKVKLSNSVVEEVRKIRSELESIRSFSRDADAREASDDGMKTWVKQVREVAWDIEDNLDEFMLGLEEGQQDGHGFVGFLHKSARPFKRLKWRHDIAMEIQNIKNRLREISERKDAYALNRTEQGCSSGNLGGPWYDLRLDSLFIEESDLEGIKKSKNQLIQWLVDGESRLSVISVVGMGGLGKTTLVKQVYDSQQVKNWFETYAWFTGSQKRKPEDLLRSTIHQFFATKKEQAPNGVDSMTGIQLIQFLRDYLQNKRYALILDDVWSTDLWNFVRNAFPDSNCSSRVVLTTRLEDVASSSCIGPSNHIYHLPPLTPEDSWSLFCAKAFQLNENRSCPPELEKLSRSFVDKCRGLPLAIVALGGNLLSKTYTEWEMIHRSLGTELESDDKLKSMMKILLLSFDDLPYYLKNCFLYFSIFPEDHHIKRMKLVRLWIAEGFVERKEGRTLEEVADGYLNQLINRNLIQVATRKACGTVVTCHVHDLLHKTISSKAKEQNFFTSAIEHGAGPCDSTRRLSIHYGGVVVPKYQLRLRSLFIFGVDGLSNSMIGPLFTRSRLLKVVDLENAPIESFPDELTNLLHLRYLSLANTKIKDLPKSVGKLIYLETLNLKGTFICELPAEIQRLQRLRHHLVYHYDGGLYRHFHSSHGLQVPAGIGSLRCLQKLAHVEANSGSGTVQELQNLTQLRRLGILNLKAVDGKDLCTSVEKMEHLRSFDVSSTDMNEVLDLHSLLNPPKLLQHLYLKGRLEMFPLWTLSLQNLAVICLKWSRLGDDPLQALQSLPNLVELQLLKAYEGGELRCQAGGYPQLKELHLLELSQLETLTVEKGAMPNLQVLWIRKCEELEEVPSCLQYLTNLKELYLWDMPEDFILSIHLQRSLSLKAGTSDLQHITSICYFDTPQRTYYVF